MRQCKLKCARLSTSAFSPKFKEKQHIVYWIAVTRFICFLQPIFVYLNRKQMGKLILFTHSRDGSECIVIFLSLPKFPCSLFPLVYICLIKSINRFGVRVCWKMITHTHRLQLSFDLKRYLLIWINCFRQKMHRCLLINEKKPIPIFTTFLYFGIGSAFVCFFVFICALRTVLWTYFRYNDPFCRLEKMR